MARKLAFVPAKVTTAVSASNVIELENIPQDVKDEVEETYAALKQNPDGRIRAEFDTEAEMAMYVRQVQSYCAQRMANDRPAPIRFRKSPSKGLTKTQMDFKITDLKTENEQKTEEIREATAAVNTAPAIDEATKTAVAEALPKAAPKTRKAA